MPDWFEQNRPQTPQTLEAGTSPWYGRFLPEKMPANPEQVGKMASRYALTALPMATGALATVALGPEAGIPLSMLVAGLGAVPGEALRQIGEETLGLEPRRTPGEAAAGMLWAAAENAAGEGAGRLLGKAGSRLIGGPLREAANAPKNIAVKEANEKYGFGLTAGQIAGETPGGTATRGVEFIGETSLFGKSAVETARTAGREHAAQAVNEALTALSSPASAETVGRLSQDAIGTGNRIFNEYAGRLYDQVDQLAQGAMVDMRPLKTEASRILRTEMDIPEALYPNLGKLENSSAKILVDIAHGPDQIPFSVAQRIRTKMLNVSPQPTELVAKEAPGIAKHFVGQLTGAMDTSANALNPAAATAWETARSFWKEGHDVFQRSLVASLMERNPELLVKSIKPGAVSDAKALKRAVIGYADQHGTAADKAAAQGAWNQFREQFARTALLKDPDAVGAGAMDIFKLKDRLTQMGQPVLNEMFGGDAAGQRALKGLTTVGEAFSRVRKNLPFTRTYLMAEGVHLAVGSVLGAYTGYRTLGMVGAETVPWAIAKIAYSPTATKYFVDGLAAFAPAAIRAPAQATTDALLRYAPEATGLLARATLTGLKEYEVFQQQKSIKVGAGKGLPFVPGTNAFPKEQIDAFAKANGISPEQAQAALKRQGYAVQ